MCWTEQWKPTKSPSLPVPLKMEVHTLILWLYSILPRMLNNMVYLDSELLCLFLLFKNLYLVFMLSLLPVKPGHIAKDHVVGYFLARKRSLGSWDGGGCLSKQPLYFQRSLEKCILCYWQAFVNFPKDTSLFPSVYLFAFVPKRWCCTELNQTK